MITPKLETKRLILRPFKMEDAEAVLKGWESDPEVARYMFWTSHNDINKTKEWLQFELEQINKNDWYRFAIEIKDTFELIGTAIIYYDNDVNSWEIGYNLGKKHWGNGYTTEAMREILAFAKNDLAILEVVGRYAKVNEASANIMKKLGFRYVADIPYECNDGKYVVDGVLCKLYF